MSPIDIVLDVHPLSCVTGLGPPVQSGDSQFGCHYDMRYRREIRPRDLDISKISDAFPSAESLNQRAVDAFSRCGSGCSDPKAVANVQSWIYSYKP